MAIFILWPLLALVVAAAAQSRGRSGLGWFILAVVLSPLVGLILVQLLPNLRYERLIASLAVGPDDARLGAFEPEGIYADIP